MGKLRVAKAGFSTTVQDAGRFGFRKFGIPISGALDSKSMDDANTLAGNPKGSPVLECTLNGGIYEFLDKAIIGVAGAPARIMLNNEEITGYESVEVSNGDVLEIGYPTRGCRTYLSIRGQFSIPKIMGSYSTYTLGKFGGFRGRALQKGDELSWTDHGNPLTQGGFPKDQIPYFSSKISIPMEPGPEFDWLEPEAKNSLRDLKFVVQPQSNRMGIRLGGQPIQSPDKQMISSPVRTGVVQLPPSGNPIILMNDGQTIGGYPRIGIVPDSELWRLGQIKAGDQVSFTLT